MEYRRLWWKQVVNMTAFLIGLLFGVAIGIGWTQSRASEKERVRDSMEVVLTRLTRMQKLFDRALDSNSEMPYAQFMQEFGEASADFGDSIIDMIENLRD
jgi:predicted negative regulator of RcsB-dependent stress response